MKILNKLTIKHLLENKKRTIVTIIGIILSTALMCGIGLLFSTVLDNSIKMIKDETGDYYASINIPSSKIDFISKNQNISSYFYKSSIGFANVDSDNEYKPYLKLYSVSNNYFDHLELISGRLPNNSSEIVISKHIFSNGGLNYKVGDKIKLDVGKRAYLDGTLIDDNSGYMMNCDSDECVKDEKLIDTKNYEFTIVGIVSRDSYESYDSPGYSIFTTNFDSESLSVFIKYKKVKDTYKNTELIASNLGYQKIDGIYEKVNYNDELLSMYGVSKYDNITSTLFYMISIILTLVSIACIIVIYNSFAISVMERKKQFGLNSSIGATRKQLKYTVFFEAFVVALIGIPLGILSSYLGIGIVIKIVNTLLPNVFSFNLELVTYPIFIIVPIIFIIITILISAYLPARMASRISPIVAIRQNDDIKINSKKIKTPKFINKIFGIEGEIAYKNIKRNKKKYRVTIVSLFISIVLFVSFSSLIKYGLESSIDMVNFPSYDAFINIILPPFDLSTDSNETLNKTVKNIINDENVKEYAIYKIESYIISNKNFTYNEKYRKSTDFGEITGVQLVGLDRKSYNNYLKQLNLKEDKMIVINKLEFTKYSSNVRKQVSYTLLDNINNISVLDDSLETPVEKTYNNFYLTTTLPYGLEYSGSATLIIIYPLDNYNNSDISIVLKGDKLDSVKKSVEELDGTSKIHAYYYNVKDDLKMITNMIIVIKILLYGFVSLVTLIGVTSVLNTINTSIQLRRREFAILRSVGLTPKGFNKILFFESLFFGLKSLIYALPTSFLIILLFHITLSDITTFESLLIPWNSILICVIAVFIIVILCNYYASSKIKKENILESLRDENI